MDSFFTFLQTMAIHPLFHHWLHLFLPYQNLSFYRSLLDFFTELTLNTSVTAHRKMHFLYTLHFAYILQNVYLWLFLPSPMDRLRQADIISIFNLTDDFYLALVALTLMILYYEVLCFTMKPSFLRLLEDTLFEDRNGVLEGVGYGNYSEQATARYSSHSILAHIQFYAQR